jgi:hypothetical protein
MCLIRHPDIPFLISERDLARLGTGDIPPCPFLQYNRQYVSHAEVELLVTGDW